MLNRTAPIVAAAIMAIWPRPANGHSLATQLFVRTYDAFGVAPRQMATARATAGTVFKRAGIEVTWRDCPTIDRPAPFDSPCDRPVGSAEIVIRIVPARPQETADTLGYSLVHGPEAIGCLATVLGDRIAAMAGRTQSQEGTLLGRVVAHEIGHLLLGTTAHSPIGLMRARWLDDEIRRDRPLDWMLSRGDAKRVRLGLLARHAL